MRSVLSYAQREMFSPDSSALYVVSGALFLLPWSLLLGSWLAFRKGPSLPEWRWRLAYAAMLIAALSTVLNMVWNGSWLSNGGSPHGMDAGPGLWQHLGRFLGWSFAAATVLSFFGKGKTRALMVGWAVSMWVVFQLIFMLQFD